MNCLILSLILFCIVSNTVSQNISESCDIDVVTDLKGNRIDIDSYCRDKQCVVKCCGENEVIFIQNKHQECRKVEDLKEMLGLNMSEVPYRDYNNLAIYRDNIYEEVSVSSKKFFDFTFLHSKMYTNLHSGCASALAQLKLLEKGTLVKFNPNHYEQWTSIATPKFCVDMKVGTKDNKTKHKYVYIVKETNLQAQTIKSIFTATSMIISAFFLLLLLVVYSLLDQLRNIQGMLLCAYAATLMLTYLLKGGQLFYSYFGNQSGTTSDCTFLSEVIYFLILSSFFWLKLMSFDIWWTFRGTRKLRKIHRRGIYVKFMIYASYAYGVPAVLTAAVAAVDRRDWPPHVVKPFFNACLVTDTVFLYLYVPVMILTGFNCLLFLMTIYNIWLISRNMAKFDKNTVKTNQSNKTRFGLYIKLSSIMGISWILEIIQSRVPDDDIPLWLFIVLNAYNVFIGVIIFFLFIFKTNIFLMLCKRFKIENRWTRRAMTASASTRSELSKSSKSYSRSYSQTRSCTDSDVEDVGQGEGSQLCRLDSGQKNPS